MPTKELLDDDYRQRMRLLRRMYGDMTLEEWADFTGIPFKVWSQYENGHPLSRVNLYILHKKLAISGDWLWFGDINGVNHAFMKQFNEARSREIKRRRSRKPRSGDG